MQHVPLSSCDVGRFSTAVVAVRIGREREIGIAEVGLLESGCPLARWQNVEIASN
jgi:hypothetical protein